MSIPKPVGRVYFAQMGDMVKIGWSLTPHKRVRHIQTSAPGPVTVLGTLRGSRETEREMHRRFAHLRRHGEWFRATEELLSLIPWLCSPSAQAEARLDQRTEVWFDIAYDAVSAIQLARPEITEDSDGVHRELLDLAEEFLARVSWVNDQALSRTERRASVFGPGARYCVRPPRRPTQAEIEAEGDRKVAAYRAREAALSAPADYLDLRAIFDSEAPDGADPTADVLWQSALGAA